MNDTSMKETFSSTQCISLVGDFTDGHFSYSHAVVTSWKTASVFNCITAVLTVYLNALVVWAILENSRLRHSTYHLTLAIQSGADIFVGLVTQPLFVAATLCRLNNCLYNCRIILAYHGFMVVGGGCSLVSLVMISVERNIAIKYPLRYKEMVTVKRLLWGFATSCGCVTAFLVTTILTIPPKIAFLRASFQMLILLPSMIVICISYIKVHKTTCKHVRAITTLLDRLSNDGNTRQRKIRLQELKRTFTPGMILVVLLLTYSPMLLLRLVLLIKGRDWNLDYNLVAYVVWTTLIHMQSLINPFIFSARLSDIRRGVLRRIPLLNRLPCCGSPRSTRQVLPIDNIVAGGDLTLAVLAINLEQMGEFHRG
ncbi:predicted protein [Nematostella vectensis]|uniref:G-protein coupled receptors family 1 profile domain-containing protein n=1 Tax=Nematostella vectensis TaxID=45351 RepID=A7S4R6_NEMVE|nr:predicted protein [Nematostella vectensis]|eukprot:XP_001633394.1 predicted protein [Nematostella vectensis]